MKNFLFVPFYFLSFQVSLAWGRYSKICRERTCEESEMFKDKKSLTSVNALECVGKVAAIIASDFFLSSSLLFPFFILFYFRRAWLFVCLLVACDWNCFLASCRVGSSPGVRCQSPAPDKPSAASQPRGLDLSLLGSSPCPAAALGFGNAAQSRDSPAGAARVCHALERM